MDVGNANFFFQKVSPAAVGYEEREAKTVRGITTAELHLNSLDRYTGGGGYSQAQNQLINGSQWAYGSSLATNLPGLNIGTNFTLGSTGTPLLNGYFSRIGISALNLTWNMPTIVTGYNDAFYMTKYVAAVPGPGGTYTTVRVSIPQGWYNLTNLATIMATNINTALGSGTSVAVAVTTPSGNLALPAGGSLTITPTGLSLFFMPTVSNNTLFPYAGYTGGPVTISPAQLQVHNMFCKMIGVRRDAFSYLNTMVPPGNTAGALTLIIPIVSTPLYTWCADLLPTDYVDVVSHTLCKYKKVRDTNSTDSRPTDVIARVYLGTLAVLGSPTTANSGSIPFTLYKEYPIINWCNWSPGEAINSIDITLLDQWGNVIPWQTQWPTEIELTLLASET